MPFLAAQSSTWDVAEVGGDAEVAGLGVIEVEAADAGSGVHGVALGELAKLMLGIS
jgi:hypothetical protein